jgi:hypothetical protein
MSDADEREDGGANHPSLFPGITFAPYEGTLRRGRADPMNRGLDNVALAPIENRIQQLKEKHQLPHHFSIHDSVQLLPERIIDTTNKDTVLMARKYNFDPDGFQEGKPLQKSMFYISPYVTCKWCNLVNHVDIGAIRRMMHLKIDKSDKQYVPPQEKLPPCKKCERADHFIIGIHDFTADIAIRMEKERIKKEKEEAAVRVLQRSYRAYLRRMYGAAFSKKAVAERLLFYKAATAMNAIARGRLARRRIVCERHLKTIKDAHPILLKHALKNPADGKKRLKVFWYRRKEQVDLLFRDYIALLDRMGHDPPRSIVEKNVAEIAKRILARKAELIIMIQKVWRGFLGRRIVRLFRVEVIRLRQWWIANILKVQRTFRGHIARVHIWKYFEKKNRNRHMKTYQRDFDKQKRIKDRKLQYTLVADAYRKQHAEEFVARSTQRIDKAKDHDMRRMRAFEASMYADSHLADRLKKLQEIDGNIVEYEAEEVSRQRTRRAFMVGRIAEHGPEGLGRRGYTRDQYLDEIIKSQGGHAHERDFRKNLKKGAHAGMASIWGNNEMSDSSLESSRSRAMRAYFQEDLTDIVDLTVERVMHDFSNKHVPKAIKNFNHSKNDSGGGLRHYKYPKNINDEPMKWLDDDIEIAIMHADKMKRQANTSQKK